MPNTPEPAAEKRTKPLDRRNAQGDHEGSPHRPEEFDAMNPARQVRPKQVGPSEVGSSEVGSSEVGSSEVGPSDVGPVPPDHED